MKQKDKLLLLKDLCARLPHGVIITDGNNIVRATQYTSAGSVVDGKWRPFLRPFSDMTEEEIKMFNSDFGGIEADAYNSIEAKRFDYLNSIHVDYRGLIPKMLAIAVTEQNNPYKD